MNEKDANSVMSSKVKLGADASAAARPEPPRDLVSQADKQTHWCYGFSELSRGMKTLRNSRDKNELFQRLQAVHPDSRRRWGSMSARQMVCHLSDGFRMYMNLKPVQQVPFHARGLVRFVALYVPIPWPHGFRTVPELDQQVGGTPPVEFYKDVEDLGGLVERFIRQPRDFTWQAHPQFGELSEKEWMRLGYLHMDHHLRQFGA